MKIINYILFFKLYRYLNYIYQIELTLKFSDTISPLYYLKYASYTLLPNA